MSYIVTSNEVYKDSGLSDLVLFECPKMLSTGRLEFLKFIRSNEYPLITVTQCNPKKYQFCVCIDLFEGFSSSDKHMCFTTYGIKQVEQIITSKVHKTICTFENHSNLIYARYLSLDDAVKIANKLVDLSDIADIWESVDPRTGRAI
jgi:hypothetical protein